MLDTTKLTTQIYWMWPETVQDEESLAFARTVVDAKTSSCKSPLLWHPSGSPREQAPLPPKHMPECSRSGHLLPDLLTC